MSLFENLAKLLTHDYMHCGLLEFMSGEMILIHPSRNTLILAIFNGQTKSK